MKQEKNYTETETSNDEVTITLSSHPKKNVRKYKTIHFKINQSNIPLFTKACCHWTKFLTLDETTLE